METLASFLDKSDAIATRTQLLDHNIESAVVDYVKDGVFTIASDDFEGTQTDLDNIEAVAASNRAVICPDCESSMVRFPAGPTEKFVLPRIVESMTSEITGTAHQYQCFKCHLHWEVEGVAVS